MGIVCIVAAVLAVLSGLYLLAVRGRSGHPLWETLGRYSYAHRGLHGNGVPENSLAAFEAAVAHGYGIELDVHLMKDGTLAVIHDASLQRTAGAAVRIEDLTAAELADYRLEGTEERIPTLPQVLALCAGKTPLILELKPERGNHAALSAAVCEAVESYAGLYCMESFDPRCLMWLKKHRPAVVRGQLAANFLRETENLPWILRFLLTHLLLNFLTVPDFVAYRFDHRRILSVTLCRKLWRVRCVGWTLQGDAAIDEAEREGWIPIFEKSNLKP